MTLAVFGKAVLIAFVAALAAWLPMALLLTADMDSSLTLGTAINMLPVAFLGSFAVGLPIALFTLFLAGASMRDTIGPVMIAANLAGFMLVLVTALLGGPFGVLFYGLPSWIAANVFGALGWFWILKPMRGVVHG